MKFLVVPIFAVFLSACGGGSDSPEPAPGVYNVEYKVEGVGAGNFADVTYQNSTGGTAQSTLAIPGTISLPATRQGDFLYISAQNKTAAGAITVSITVNGVVFKSTTSSGAYVIATASSSCCK